MSWYDKAKNDRGDDRPYTHFGHGDYPVVLWGYRLDKSFVQVNGIGYSDDVIHAKIQEFTDPSNPTIWSGRSYFQNGRKQVTAYDHRMILSDVQKTFIEGLENKDFEQSVVSELLREKFGNDIRIMWF